MKIYHIYKITNILNGKIYIGQTCQKNPTNRYYKHLTFSRKNDPGPLYKAIRKYGEQFFKFELLFCCENIENCNFMEIYFIKEYKSKTDQNGYNVMSGGDQYSPTEEYCENLSKKMKEVFKNKKPWNFGLIKIEKIINKKRINHKSKRKVICIETGQVFNGVQETANYFGSESSSSVSRVCQGKRRSFRGLSFKYVEETE